VGYKPGYIVKTKSPELKEFKALSIMTRTGIEFLFARFLNSGKLRMLDFQGFSGLITLMTYYILRNFYVHNGQNWTRIIREWLCIFLFRLPFSAGEFSFLFFYILVL
jgi:hypothetical protein